MHEDYSKALQDGKRLFCESEFGQYVLQRCETREEYMKNRLICAKSWDEVIALQAAITEIRKFSSLINLLDMQD